MSDELRLNQFNGKWYVRIDKSWLLKDQESALKAFSKVCQLDKELTREEVKKE